MNTPKMLVPVMFLFGLLKWTSATAAAADSAESGFRQDLFPVSFPIHVIPEGPDNDALGYRQKAHITPKVKCDSRWLEEPVFDVTEFFRMNGLSVPEKSQFLFSPSAGLVFISSTPGDLALARTLTGGNDVAERFTLTFDLQVLGKSRGKSDRRIIDLKSIGFVSGQREELHISDDTDFHLILEPMIGPDLEGLDLNIDAALRTHGRRIELKTSWATSLSKPISARLGNLGSESIVLQIQFHKELENSVHGALQMPAQKAEAIKEIQEALKAAH